jgi:hypothetical protein
VLWYCRMTTAVSMGRNRENLSAGPPLD